MAGVCYRCGSRLSLWSSSIIFLLCCVAVPFFCHDAVVFGPSLTGVHGHVRRLYFQGCDAESFHWVQEAFPGDSIRFACNRAVKTVPADMASVCCKGTAKKPCSSESEVTYRSLFPTAPSDFVFLTLRSPQQGVLDIPANLKPPYPTFSFGWEGSQKSDGTTPTAMVTVVVKEDPDSPVPPASNSTVSSTTTGAPGGGSSSSSVAISPSLLSFAPLFSAFTACFFGFYSRP